MLFEEEEGSHMGTVSDINDARWKKGADHLVNNLHQLFSGAENIWTEFGALLEHKPEEAVHRLPEFMERVQKIHFERCFIEDVGVGQQQDWIVPLMNALGRDYAYFPDVYRRELVYHCRNYFDLLPYYYVQNHVVLLEDPLMVAEIVLPDRLLYLPGNTRELLIVGHMRSPDDMESTPTELLERFWVCLAMIRNSHRTTLPTRHWYYSTFPQLLERTLVFVAAWSVAVVRGNTKKGIPLATIPAIDRFLVENVDPTLHDRVKKKIREHEWLSIP